MVKKQTSPGNLAPKHVSLQFQQTFPVSQEAVKGDGSEDEVFWMVSRMQLWQSCEPCAGQHGTTGAAAPEPLCKTWGCHRWEKLMPEIHYTELRAFL